MLLQIIKTHLIQVDNLLFFLTLSYQSFRSKTNPTMEFDNEELYRWIDQHSVSRPKRNISRDFSDALPLVEIIKQHFPKRVEIHNYSPQNSFQRKLNNWLTLNRKVLSKLGMELSNETMKNLAHAKSGVIEMVLNDIKKKIEKLESRQADGDKGDVLVFEGSSTGSLVIPVKVKTGNKVKNKKMVPAEIYDRMENDLKQKEEQLKILQEKVAHLESMLELKDGRIKDLTQQLNVLVNSSKPVGEKLRCSRFFN